MYPLHPLPRPRLPLVPLEEASPPGYLLLPSPPLPLPLLPQAWLLLLVPQPRLHPLLLGRGQVVVVRGC